MRKGWAITLSVVFSVLLAVHMLISFVMLVGLDKDIYKNAQVADEIYSYAGISQESLDMATEGLIDYIDDKRDDLVITSSENEGFELFNAKEKAHMIDVKNLFVLSKKVNFAFFLIIMLILIFYVAYDKEGMRKYFLKYCAITLSIVLGAWIIIAVLAAIDFDTFWTAFHQVFFRNELWLLNPETDLLIRMMPQRFFVRIVIHIAGRFLISYILVISLLSIGHKLLNRKHRKIEKGKA